jgi:hypothetical protein
MMEMLINVQRLTVEAIYIYFVAKFSCSDESFTEVIPYSNSLLNAEMPSAELHWAETPGAVAPYTVI